MELIFWVLFLIVCYVYAGYPLLLILLSTAKRTKLTDVPDVFPSVTMLIAAYNEEESIEKKIENTLQIDYPEDKLEVIIVSDGSTDRTNEIVKRYENKGIRLNHIERHVLVFLGVPIISLTIEESAVGFQDIMDSVTKVGNKSISGSFKIHIAQRESGFDAGQGL